MLISNDGPRILSTDYWTTEHAAHGLAYLSVNAGALRLLVPQLLEPAIAEMRTAAYAIVSLGTHDETGRAAYHLLFEDHSDAPFALVTENFDRAIAEERREGLSLSVWTQPAELALEMRAYFRRVPRVPCGDGWG
jgi:hypothetical protein